MKVKDLIRELSKLEDFMELRVVIPGYEAGYDDVTHVSLVKAIINGYGASPEYGAHIAVEDAEDSSTAESVVLLE